MPVERFGSAEAKPRPPLADEGTLAARISALWARTARLAPPYVVRGVQRFRTIEDANRARDEATARRMRSSRAGPMLHRSRGPTR